jgi:hypothetical protein
MSDIPILPNELVEHITSCLSIIDDRSTVQACALASKSWLARLRPVLFSVVSISPVPIRPLPTTTEKMVLSYAQHLIIDSNRSSQAVAILKTLCAIAPHLSERFHSLELLLNNTSMQEWEIIPLLSMLERPNFHRIRDRVTSLSLQTVSIERGLGALLLSAFPHVTSFQCYRYPYAGRYSYPKTARPPVFLASMRLSRLSWKQGPVTEISDSLRSPPIVDILQHLDIVFSDSLDQWRTIESLLSQLNALVDLRITMQQHKPTPGTSSHWYSQYLAGRWLTALFRACNQTQQLKHPKSCSVHGACRPSYGCDVYREHGDGGSL